jgi:hypothetical protein
MIPSPCRPPSWCPCLSYSLCHSLVAERVVQASRPFLQGVFANCHLQFQPRTVMSVKLCQCVCESVCLCLYRYTQVRRTTICTRLEPEQKTPGQTVFQKMQMYYDMQLGLS